MKKLPEHSNPQKKRQHFLDKKKTDSILVESRAPYNFVPLPDSIVLAKQPIPPQGKYSKQLLTGRIDCELSTLSPTYIRGIYSQSEFQDFGEKKWNELSEEEKEKKSKFYSYQRDKQNSPVIPGSSIRGMIRTIVEVISFSRIKYVSNKPTFTFRAVAAESEDPLKKPYTDAVNKEIKAGFFEKTEEAWYIHPALALNALGIVEKKTAFLKINDEDIEEKDVPGFIHIGSPGYIPQIFEVSFAKNSEITGADDDESERRDKFLLSSDLMKYPNHGFLVCSGDMNENSSGEKKTNRKKHYLIMPKDINSKAIPVPEQVIQDYLSGMTTFQKENLTAWHNEKVEVSDTTNIEDKLKKVTENTRTWGCISPEKPVFFMSKGSGKKEEVAFFGHSPNFRIPAELIGFNRASIPVDFIPENQNNPTEPDITDSIFGYVDEENGNKRSCVSGRVFFGDAKLDTIGSKGIWFDSDSTIPKILASPKVTTFQHYLVQDKDNRHDPDIKAQLAHYGTTKDETNIRGNKFYWHKGKTPDIKADLDQVKKHPTQFTRIRPIQSELKFKFSINFENLYPYELGSILWAIKIPANSDKNYCHKIGMGKPLGMGAVSLSCSGFFSNRWKKDEVEGRYQKIFSENKWFTPENKIDDEKYIKLFEDFILNNIEASVKTNSFCEVPRIKELLTILEWKGDDPDQDWLELTRYMEIEHKAFHNNKEIIINEYKSRPVLPTPSGVIRRWKNQPEPEKASKLATEFMSFLNNKKEKGNQNT